MSQQEKGYGLAAYEAFIGLPITPEKWAQDVQDKVMGTKEWDRAGQAVAARVREECARIADDHADMQRAASDGCDSDESDDASAYLHAAQQIRRVASAIRALNEAHND